MLQPPLRSTLFPYTTLFRSLGIEEQAMAVEVIDDPCVGIARPRDDQREHERRQKRGSHAASPARSRSFSRERVRTDRKSTRLNSSHGYISYAVFCLKKKKK